LGPENAYGSLFSAIFAHCFFRSAGKLKNHSAAVIFCFYPLAPTR
jgi:hypothetical protein